MTLRYDDEYIYIFWRKGFGTEASVFEKLKEFDLVRWYKKRKAEEKSEIKD